MKTKLNLTRYNFEQKVKDRVLQALDDAYYDLTGHPDAGWKDGDLPDLFKALTSQTSTLWKRAGGTDDE